MDHFDVEIYSPPYLFRGARPAIDDAPSSFGHGESFFVETAEAADIGAVHLLRLGSVTHAFNQNQWINRLAFTSTANGVIVTAPGTGVEAPPGPYMLFILNNDGVPSEASMVQLLPNAGRIPSSSLEVNRLTGGELELSWQPSCAADDFDHAIYEGTLGDFSSHMPVACSTGGLTSVTFSAGSGDRYYLVVPRNTVSEGSYGLGLSDTERAPTGTSCLPQSIGGCS
jgi:hypothetical protein